MAEGRYNERTSLGLGNNIQCFLPSLIAELINLIDGGFGGWTPLKPRLWRWSVRIQSMNGTDGAQLRSRGCDYKSSGIRLEDLVQGEANVSATTASTAAGGDDPTENKKLIITAARLRCTADIHHLFCFCYHVNKTMGLSHIDEVHAAYIFGVHSVENVHYIVG